MLALMLHETGHLIASVLFGCMPERIELTPFGGVMEYASGKSPDKGVKGALTALAGPASNCMTLMVLSDLGRFVPLSAAMCRAVAMSSFAMLCVNLLPVLPLDGGRLLFSIGYYFFPVLPLIKALSGCGIALGSVCITGVAYGAWRYSDINLSLLFVGGYMIYCARQCRVSMIAENMIAVIQERRIRNAEIRCLRAYSVSKHTELRRILSLLDQSKDAVFLCEDTNGVSVFLEGQIYKELLRNPVGRFSDL